MSRYFDETNKAEQWSGTAPELNVEQLVATVQQGEEVAKQVATTRLRETRMVKLPNPKDAPLLTRRDEAMAPAAESYRMLRTRLLRLQAAQGIRSVVLSSALPGEGKTLTTLNLALCCTQIPNLRVLIVDADFRTRGLSHLLGTPSGPGLSEILSGEATYEQAIMSTDLPNLCVLTGGGATKAPAELFATQRWKEFLGWASETFKLVLVDSPPILPLSDFELISAACDGVLLVIRGGRTNRELLRRASVQVDSRKLLGSVFNMSRESGNANHHRYGGVPDSAGEGA